MRQFATTPQLYVETSYQPPAGITANANLPTAIRQLKEVVDQKQFSNFPPPITPPTRLIESPIKSAQRELEFFSDLWHTLFFTRPPAWEQYAVSATEVVSLRDLWLDILGGSVGSSQQYQHKVFWYDASNQLQWIDMPAPFPLIDFYWRETELSRRTGGSSPGLPGTAGTLALASVSTSEESTLDQLVAELERWYPPPASGPPPAPDFRMVPTSHGACLLEMMRTGYNAKEETFGRHWLRLKNGHVPYVVSTNPDVIQWSSQTLTSNGDIPAIPGPLALENRPWSALAPLAFPFPDNQLATLFHSAALPVPYSALYANYPESRAVRQTLGPTEINALVFFFLALGGHLTDPDNNNGNPSTKLARFQRLGNSESTFLLTLPPTYPLTDGLQRLTAVRALLDTHNYLQTITPSGTPPPMGIPLFGQCFRTRAYHETGQVWPATLPTPSDAECIGGSLRAVAWNEDGLNAGFVSDRGFQPRFLGVGGSIATLLALFPDNQTSVDSYFWCTPGVELMADNAWRQGTIGLNMNAFATNDLLPSHYEDFADQSVSNPIRTVFHVY